MSRGFERSLATIYDVAARANVSVATVSRHLAGFEGIRPATRQRVQEALDELRYKPNLTARSLATNRSHRLGALIYELQEAGPGHVLIGATERAQEAGYVLDLIGLDPHDELSIAQALSLLDQQNLAGIIATVPTYRLRSALRNSGLKVPLYIEDEVSTGSARIAGVDLLVEHLVELGHRHILHVTGPPEWVSVRRRQTALRDALNRFGLPAAVSIEGDWSAGSGYAAIKRMDSLDGITAVFAENDQTALGVLDALNVRGISVPGDISVVGYDDIPEAAHFRPRLTTVHKDFKMLGRFAVNSVLSSIHGTPDPDRADYEKVKLIVRESTAPPIRPPN